MLMRGNLNYMRRLIWSTLASVLLAGCTASPATASPRGGFGFGFPHKTQTIVPQSGAPVIGAITYDTSMGTAVDANGFTSLPLRAGAKAFYVSSSIGNDSNTCTQAQTASTPKATYTSAKGCLTDGAGDHILMRQDDSFVAGLEAFAVNGFSPAYPFTVESYDPADPTNQAKWGRATGTHRPILNTGGTVSQNFVWGNPYHYIAVRGLDFNPGNVGYTEVNNVGGTGASTTYLLYENNKFEYTALNFAFATSTIAYPARKVIVRNNVLYGMWSPVNSAGSQGIYIENTNGITFEDNVFYHAGWKIGATRTDVGTSGGATQFNHPIYAAANANEMVVRRNAFIAGSADGGNLKGGGIYQGNFSLNNPIAWSAGSGNQFSLYKPWGSYIDMAFNAAIGSDTVQDSGATGWGMTSNDGRPGGLATEHHNVVARNNKATSGGLFISTNYGDPNHGDYKTVNDATIFDHNVSYLQDKGAGCSGFTNGSLATATNNVWDCAASGSNVNVGSVTLPNAYTEATLLAALPGTYASETAAVNDWIANPEQHGWRTAAALVLAGYGVVLPAQVDLKTDMRITAGTATDGTFIGTRDGFDLSPVSGLPACVTIDSGGRAWHSSAGCTTSSGTLVLRETNGTTSHDSSIAWQIYPAPVLSSLSVTPSTTTAAVNVSTTVGSGSIYATASTNATIVSYWPEVRAGYITSDTAATAAATQAVTATGAQSAITLSGLTASTGYRLRIAQADANHNASAVSTLDFTTTSGIAWNPADKGTGIVLSGSNLIADNSTGTAYGVRSTTGKASGKWYWEVVVNQSGGSWAWWQVGVGNSTAALNAQLGSDANSAGYYVDLGVCWVPGGSCSALAASPGDVIGVAMDVSTGKGCFAKNNVWQGSCDPVAETNTFTLPTGTIYPMTGGQRGNTTAHFTSGSQTYSPPTGYTPIGFLAFAIRRRRRCKVANDNGAGMKRAA